MIKIEINEDWAFRSAFDTLHRGTLLVPLEDPITLEERECSLEIRHKDLSAIFRAINSRVAEEWAEFIKDRYPCL